MSFKGAEGAVGGRVVREGFGVFEVWKEVSGFYFWEDGMWGFLEMSGGSRNVNIFVF